MDSRNPFADSLRGRRTFATTRWSVVLSAGHASSPDAQQALALLCQTYWPPLYAYVRQRVADRDLAMDLTQAFFATLLEKNYVGAATPERGRFRAYLLTAFKHFLSKEREKSRAQKRGGGAAAIPLDFASVEPGLRIEPAAGLTPDQWYDRQWALTLLSQAMDALHAEFQQEGKAQQWERLKSFLVGDQAGTYAEVAAQLRLSEAAARKAVSRMRRRYRQLLRQAISQTVSTPEEIDDEIRDLFTALAR